MPNPFDPQNPPFNPGVQTWGLLGDVAQSAGQAVTNAFDTKNKIDSELERRKTVALQQQNLQQQISANTAQAGREQDQYQHGLLEKQAADAQEAGQTAFGLEQPAAAQTFADQARQARNKLYGRNDVGPSYVQQPTVVGSGTGAYSPLTPDGGPVMKTDWENGDNQYALRADLRMSAPTASFLSNEGNIVQVMPSAIPGEAPTTSTITQHQQNLRDNYMVVGDQLVNLKTNQVVAHGNTEVLQQAKEALMKADITALGAKIDVSNANTAERYNAGLNQAMMEARHAVLQGAAGLGTEITPQVLAQAELAAQSAAQSYRATVGPPPQAGNPFHPGTHPAAGPVGHAAALTRWAPQVNSAAQAYGLDPEMLYTFMGKENALGNPTTVGSNPSGQRDVGLFQVGADIHGVSEKQLYDPQTNANTAAKLIRSLLDANHGNVQAAAAAYNGSGPAARAYGADFVSKYHGTGYANGGTTGPRGATPRAQAMVGGTTTPVHTPRVGGAPSARAQALAAQ